MSKWTLETAGNEASKMGLTLVQINGIPEGFSYKKDGVTIGDITHPDSYIAFVPLTDKVVTATSIDDLTAEYRFNVK